MKRLSSFFAIIFLLVSILSSLAQTNVKTLVLRPGPSDGIDSDIRTDLPDTPRGWSPDFIANAWTAQGNYFTQRSLLKFDLSQIPAGASVVQSTLYLFTNLTTGHHQLDSGANAACLYRITQAWSPDQVTWNNQPAFSTADYVSLAQSVSHTQNYIVDVTAHVSDMVANPSGNFGWLFKLQTEEKYRCMVFASSNNLTEEWRPKLVIQYTSCTNPLAAFSFDLDYRTVHFTDLSSSATSWNWTFGDGTSSNDQNPAHTYVNPGNYQVCLEIADSCGTGSHCTTLNIPCTLPVIGFTYDFTFTTVNFTDTSVCAHPLAWFWEFGDSATSTIQNPVHEYANYGGYNVCLTVTDSCGQNVLCRTAWILQPLQPGFTSQQNVTDNLKVAFQDASTGASWWLWDFGDGKSSGERNPVHEYEKFGDYNVCQTAGNAGGQETTCNPLKVAKIDVSGNGNSILFYPNPLPTGGKLKLLLFEDSGLANIIITDLAGKMIREQEFRDIRKNEPTELDISGLDQGTYLLECSFNNYRKIIKLVVL